MEDFSLKPLWKWSLKPCTDNAAMVAVAGYFKFLKGDFASQDLVPYARQSLKD